MTRLGATGAESRRPLALPVIGGGRPLEETTVRADGTVPAAPVGGRLWLRWEEALSAAGRRQLLLGMLVLYGLVHACYWAAGVRFDVTPLSHFWQYLDPELLRSRLGESLLYLHVQPPLFNAFLGVVLQLGGEAAPQVFQAAYVSMGFGLYVALHSLMRRMGVRQLVALCVSTLFMASPAFILYEHWLFYTFPLALMLVLSGLALSNALRSGHFWPAVMFFALLGMLGAIRSLFHLAYFLLMVALLWWQSPGRRRKILLAALAPCLLLVALYGKNALLFDRFTNSTWLGMNLWGVISRNIPPEEVRTLVVDGQLSPVAEILRFSALESYPAEYQDASAFAEIPAVSNLRKSTGAVNYNHVGYMAVSDQYLADAMRVLRRYPRYYLIGVGKAWFSYLQSSTDYAFLAGNRMRIAGMDSFTNTVFYGKLPYDLGNLRFLPLNPETDGPRQVYLFLAIGLPLLVVLTFREIWRRRLPRDRWLLLIYILFNVCYVAVAGNALEVGENNRFRFMTDPFYATMLALLLQQAIDARRPAPSAAQAKADEPS